MTDGKDIKIVSIKELLELLSIPQFYTLTVNTIISQLNIPTNAIVTLDDLYYKDHKILEQIYAELCRNMKVTMQVRFDSLKRNTPLGF